jgi:lauroyl/myristoyl acyltransferase
MPNAREQLNVPDLNAEPFSGQGPAGTPGVASPPPLYRSGPWKIGLGFARLFPLRTAHWISRRLARLYLAGFGARLDVVARNLQPVIGNTIMARESARRVFQNFAVKLVDLWRYEAGLDLGNLLAPGCSWDEFLQARSRGRGVLLLTMHIGNWEFGAPLLARQGIDLVVITLAEPDDALTELRQSARRRAGIKTVVIGRDPFAFVEIIRHLEAGATVALLMDRPPPGSSVPVTFFGRPFAASVAAAELARATGCALLPVYLPRTNEGKYQARILPNVPYEQRMLRSPERRQELTQRIMAAFEPAVREHVDQWYHFVPVWL